MKKIHEININSTTKNEYKTIITLVELAGSIYYVFTKTDHEGVINEYEERCESYQKALHLFLENVSEYATHTAIMNL